MKEPFKNPDGNIEDILEEIKRGFEEAKQDRIKLREFMSKSSAQRGIELERAVLDLLENKLLQESIDVRAIKKECMIDKEGTFFIEEYETDVFVLFQNGKTILIDVSVNADNRDVNDLVKKAKLYDLLNSKAHDALMFLCLEINQTNFEFAIRHGVKVITGEIN